MTTVLITGANRGIGLEFVKQLRERGLEVLAVCRNSSTELQATGAEILDGVDVTSDEAVAGLVARVGDRGIDLLILNAGVLQPNSLGDMDFESVRRQFEVNSLGPLRVTHALLGKLQAGSKIAIITSRMGSITDNDSGAYYGYRMSKAAVNAFGKSLSIDLRDRGVAVAVLHPGWVKTDMTGHTGNVDAAESARNLLARIDELDLARSGEFRHMDGQDLPW